jgi:hypothetical protein
MPTSVFLCVCVCVVECVHLFVCFFSVHFHAGTPVWNKFFMIAHMQLISQKYNDVATRDPNKKYQSHRSSPYDPDRFYYYSAVFDNQQRSSRQQSIPILYVFDCSSVFSKQVVVEH